VCGQNAIEDAALVPGAGSFEVAAHAALMRFRDQVTGKPKLGVQVRRQDLLRVIPLTPSSSDLGDLRGVGGRPQVA
jgi:T-complex protein 1 subunit zeta